MHYNWHRHYDPSLGRYTQPDPLELEPGPNVYLYANATPEAATDPTGESPWTFIRIVIATGGAAIKICMTNPRCRKAIENLKDTCANLDCKLSRERADHQFPGRRWCEHYRLTCWIKGKGRIFEYQWPIPGRCHDQKQKELYQSSSSSPPPLDPPPSPGSTHDTGSSTLP